MMTIVATVLTVYGIETSAETQRYVPPIRWVVTALTVYSILIEPLFLV